jgi:hypothetical protein
MASLLMKGELRTFTTDQLDEAWKMGEIVNYWGQFEPREAE